jgi:hypothetical protein
MLVIIVAVTIALLVGLVLISPPLAGLALLFAGAGATVGYTYGWNRAIRLVKDEQIERAEADEDRRRISF